MSNDMTGAPIQYNPRQHEGYVYFKFVDNSFCEEAFSIHRIDSGGMVHVIAPNFYYYMTSKCNSEITPGKEFSDDMVKSELIVGNTYTYCVSAVATEYMAQLPDSRGNFKPFLKSSAANCIPYTPHWVSNFYFVMSTNEPNYMSLCTLGS